MSKYALIIANTDYTDPGLATLTAPGRDAEDLARVLKAKDIGAFDDVTMLMNESEPVVREEIDNFFSMKKSDDLLVMYFSGHGVRDEYGSLYLAVKNTNRGRLRSTAIKSDFVRESMDQSRSKRLVLILDCCNSGAFAHGTKAATGVSIGTGSAFEGTGYGRVVLTATDATQFAWEGDQIIGETDNSLFTHFLVKGLEGDADEDGDGKITVDELYDYAYEQIVSRTPKQTPGKWSYKQQGEMVLRQAARIEDTRPVPLPADLIAALESSYPSFRESAIRQLEELLKTRNVGLARSARAALERMAAEDDSRRVAQLAAQVLEPLHQAEQRAEEERLAAEKAQAEQKAQEEIARVAAQQAEEKRIAWEKAYAEQKANEEAQRLAAQQAEEERIAREAVLEQKAREAAESLAAQQAEEERIAREKMALGQKAREAAQQAEEERIAREKAEIEQKAREAAARLAVEQAEEEGIAREKTKQEALQSQQREQAEHETAIKAAREAESEMREKVAREKTKQPTVKSPQRAQLLGPFQRGFIIFLVIVLLGSFFIWVEYNAKLISPAAIPTLTVTPAISQPSDLLAKQREWAGSPLFVYYSDREDPAPTPGYLSQKYTAIYFSKSGSSSPDDLRISGFGKNVDPVWSPTGMQIAYINASQEPVSIMLTDHKGEVTRTIAGNLYPSSGNGLSWSPDGRMLAFQNWNEHAVVVLDVETGSIRKIVSKEGEEVSWSPDGQKLAFWVRSGKDQNDADGWVVYIVNVDGTNLTQVTKTSDLRGDFGPFMWTPDGNYLTYISFSVDGQGNRGNYETWIVPSSGQSSRSLQSNEIIEVIDQRYYPWFRHRSLSDGGFDSIP